MTSEKRCGTCSETKPITAFHARRFNRRDKAGLPYVYEHISAVCKACEHRAHTEYGRTPEGKASARRQWDTNEKRRGYATTEAGRATSARYRGTIKSQARQIRSSAKIRAGGDLDGDLTAVEWEAILDLYRWTCAYCRVPLEKDAEVGHPRKLTVDHVVPLISGGRHSKENVIPSCWRCNERKGQQIIRPLPPPQADTRRS